MRKKEINPTGKRDLNRTHRHTFVLNEEEEKALSRYIAKYRIRNQSKFIRETLIAAIIHQLEEDHPTLF